MLNYILSSSEQKSTQANDSNTLAQHMQCTDKWFFYTKNHYKIWFSKNPNIFLDIENQLRFIKLLKRIQHYFI